MPSWKKVILSGSDAALNSLNVTTSLTASGIIYPTVDGTDNQVIKTDGNGNLFFDNVITTTISIKNVSGGTIIKGTPCYITGSGTAGNVAGVWPADASNPLRMPAGVIAGETLNNGDEGIGLINGFINGVNTSAFASGDSIYVAVGGGYTNVRPTGSSVLIQKLGNVEKVDASNGSGVINGPGYYNEVPNIQQGYTWVGNSNGVATPIATSSIQNVVSSSFATNSTTATQTSQAITFNNGGAGAASGTTFNGSTARTISYNTIGAQPLLTNPVTGTGTTNYLPKFTGTSNLGNSLIFDNGTNVGIGTTSPASRLETSRVDTGVHWTLDRSGTDVGSIGASSVGLRIDSIAGGSTIFNSSGLDVDFIAYSTGFNSALFVQGSSGNVGIGTTSPSEKLHVIGNGIFTGNVTSTNFIGNLTGQVNKITPQALSWSDSYIQNYRNRLLDDGYTYFPNQASYNFAILKTLNIQNKASIVVYPSATKTSLLPAVKGLPLDFARSTTKTYVDEDGVLQTAPINTPTITYDSNGDAVFSLEPASTNLALRSEEFDGTYWTKDGTAIVTPNTTIAPNGTLTADTVSGATGATTTNTVRRTFIGLNTTHTSSVYVKSLGATTFSINMRNGISGVTQRKIVSLTNEWQRVESSSIIQDGQVAFGGSDGDFAIWGAQLEALPYATSYIPTGATTVTRTAETCRKTGLSSYINSSEGVLYAEMSALADNIPVVMWLSLSDNSANNRVSLYFQDVRIRAFSNTNGVTQTSFNTTPNNLTDSNKVAFKFKDNDFSIWLNGVEIGTNNSATTPVGLNTLRFDNGGGGNPFYGKIKSLKVFTTALSDSELQTLTTL